MDQAEVAINAATSNTEAARRRQVNLFSQERAAARRAYDAHEQRMKPHFDEAKEVQKKLLSVRQQLQKDADNEIREKVFDAGVMAYIVKPFTVSDVTPAIEVATSRWAELKALESEVADLGERLETRKAVEKAKGVLMKKLKISEAEAFRWIQKTAMDRRLGMREVADAVVAGMDKA